MKIRFLSSAAESRSVGLPSPHDEAAIARLYLMYKDQFTAFISNYFECDDATAADLYQESFLAMYQNLAGGRIEPRSASLKTYLFQIGKFKAASLSRSRKNSSKVDISGVGVPETPQSEEWLRLQEIAAEEVAAMPEPCSSVLLLYYWERKNMIEIARRMNYKNERIAINRKSLCLKRLKELLARRLKKEGLDYYDNE